MINPLKKDCPTSCNLELKKFERSIEALESKKILVSTKDVTELKKTFAEIQRTWIDGEVTKIDEIERSIRNLNLRIQGKGEDAIEISQVTRQNFNEILEQTEKERQTLAKAKASVDEIFSQRTDNQERVAAAVRKTKEQWDDDAVNRVYRM